MKKFLSIFLGSIFLMFFVNSCTDKPEITVRGPEIVTLSDKAPDGTLLAENISIKMEKLFYRTGSIIIFSGRIFDSKEKGIAEVQVSIEDPVLSKSALSPKTDKEGRFIYTMALPQTAKGSYVFVFYYKSAKAYITITISSGNAPGAPSNPSPANGAVNVSLNPVLSWSAKDPDGDALKYAIYFGENTSAPKKISDQSGAEFKPGTLVAGKKYYWKIVAFDGKDGETSGDWWSFTTEKSGNNAPIAPFDPKPANGAVNVSLNPVLSWISKDPDGDALKYAIYFGENTSAPKKISDQSGAEFKPGTLAPGKKYYWKIVAFDGKGGETSGDWWSFTTEKSGNNAPGAPSNPSPANGSEKVSLTPVLNWTAKDPDGDALKFVVYFGENTSAPKKISDLGETAFKPGTLAPGKKYYWKIVAYDGKGGESSGDWWSFTTVK